MQLVDWLPLFISIIGLLSAPIGYTLGRKRERAEVAKTEAETRKIETETSDIVIENYKDILKELRKDLTKLRNDMETERTRYKLRESELQTQIKQFKDLLDQREEEWSAELQTMQNQITALKGRLTRERNQRKELERELAVLRPPVDN